MKSGGKKQICKITENPNKIYKRYKLKNTGKYKIQKKRCLKYKNDTEIKKHTKYQKNTAQITKMQKLQLYNIIKYTIHNTHIQKTAPNNKK